MIPPLFMNKLLLFAIASVLLFAGCRSGGMNDNVKLDRTETVIDSTLMFDGQSLGKWEITNFGPQGPVFVSNGRIILSMGDGCTGINWTGPFPESNYEVTLDAMKLDGNDFFCGLTFPVGKDPCTLIIGGWGGTTVGLSSINGYDASENETTKLIKFDKDRWYNIRLAVTDNNIKAWIDSTNVVDFTIGDKRLSIRPEVELSKPFGITSWRTTAAIRNIRVTRIE
jgi:hypothetical protein